jgi:hypothetical protein
MIVLLPTKAEPMLILLLAPREIDSISVPLIGAYAPLGRNPVLFMPTKL